MSQLTGESAPGSDGIGSHHLAISMEKNHCLAMKIKHIDDERNLQFQQDKMQYENSNAQVIHVRVMENKEAEIRLEEAKADAAIKVMKAKQVEVEVLRLSLMMKGIMPDANVAP